MKWRQPESGNNHLESKTKQDQSECVDRLAQMFIFADYIFHGLHTSNLLPPFFQRVLGISCKQAHKVTKAGQSPLVHAQESVLIAESKSRYAFSNFLRASEIAGLESCTDVPVLSSLLLLF